jgi:uncharacterized protein HemX
MVISTPYESTTEPSTRVNLEHPAIEEEVNAPRRTRQRSNKLIRYVLLPVVTLSVWGGLLYGGYWLAQQYIADSHSYIDQQIQRVQEQNTQHMSQVVAELQRMQAELDQIQEELVFADKTVNGSNQTRQALQERMTTLDKQLSELKLSLEKLEGTIGAP